MQERGSGAGSTIPSESQWPRSVRRRIVEGVGDIKNAGVNLVEFVAQREESGTRSVLEHLAVNRDLMVRDDRLINGCLC